MSIPLFFPKIEHYKALKLISPLTIQKLCHRAGIKCKASGNWINRKVELVTSTKPRIQVEPGNWGKIKIYMNKNSQREQARYALGILAYLLNDIVAKESICGMEWTKITPPPGRPKKIKALSNRERQRRYREKRYRENHTQIARS